MARIDPQLNLRVPLFVKAELKGLVREVKDTRASETEIVAALIHEATAAKLRPALVRYRRASPP